MADQTHDIRCLECGTVVSDYLPDHLLEAHGLTTTEYLSAHPGVATVSERLWGRFEKDHPAPRRAHPPAVTDLSVTFAKIRFPVNPDVPEEVCLPLPDHYRLPQHGLLGSDVQHAVIGLRKRRSMYIWGLPGSGKDALFHAWSAMTRTPAIIRQVKPGTDIEAWCFSRAFNEQGTHWEEGEVLKALRDGFLTSTGRRVPYLVLLTDFDRADPEQAEHLRLITDSIQGRIDGPAGRVYRVMPGSIVVATGNTSGGGDARGRMISARPMDGSLMDRFNAAFEFHWMDWEDEREIVRAKFPLLMQRCPSALVKMGTVTKNLREAILNDTLHGEFSHRGLCSILEHAQDMLECDPQTRVPANLLAAASKAWLDKLPDAENREVAVKIMDAEIATLPEGDTTHIGSGSLMDVLSPKVKS